MKKIFFFLLGLMPLWAIAQQPPAPAEELLAGACKKAAAEHKNVFVIFHASWCGWCKKMEASLEDTLCRKFFTDNYMFVHLVVHENDKNKKQENPGAAEILNSIEAKNEGIPVWVVYNAEGKLLADSFIRTADGKKTNTGCPASKEEIGAFIKVLKATSSITRQQEEDVTTVFSRNN